MQVHNAELKNGTLVKEAFQSNGSGSAFETRENELVVLNVDTDGLPQLVKKVNQLVDGGFHAIVVHLIDVEQVEGDELAILGECYEILARWGGWIGICGLEGEACDDVRAHAGGNYDIYDDVESAVKAAEGRPREQLSGEFDTSGLLSPEDVADIPDSLLVSDAEDDEDIDDIDVDDDESSDEITDEDEDESAEDILDAADVLQSGDVESLDELESIDELSAFESGESELPSLGESDDVPEIQDSHDTTLPKGSGLEDDAPLKLDWSQADALVASGASFSLAEAKAAAELIRLDLAVEELEHLSKRIKTEQKRGGKHVLLTLNLGRRGTLVAEDIEFLRKGQSLTTDSGGRFMLVSLPTEVKVWLRLKNFAAEFETYDDSKSAREALKAPPPVQTEAVTFEITDYDDESALIEASSGEGDDTELLTIVDISTGKLVGLDALIERLGEDEVPEVVLESADNVEIPEGSLETLKVALTKASECGVIVSLINYSGDLSSLIKGFAGHVKAPDDLREAVLGAAQRHYKETPFKTLEYGFERVALGLARSDEFGDGQPILRADTVEFNRDDFGVAEGVEEADESDTPLETLMAKREVELAKLRAENAMLREQDDSGLGDKLATLKEQLASETDDKQKAEAEVALLSGQLDEIRRQLNSERERGKDLEKVRDEALSKSEQIEELQAQLDSAKDELLTEREKLSTAEESAKSAEEQHAELSAKVEAAEQALSEAKSEKESLESRISELESGLSEQKESSEQVDELKSQLAELESVQAKNTELEKTVAELQSELETASTAAADESASADLEAKNAELEKQVEELKAELEAKASEAQDSDATAELTEKAEALKSQVAELKSELENAQQQLAEHLENAEAEASDPAELEELRESKSELESRVAELENQVEESEKKSRRLEKELELAGDQGERKAGLIDLDSLPDDVEELRFLVMQAEQDKLKILADAEVEIERLARQEEMLREELESAGEMIERLGKELELS